VQQNDKQKLMKNGIFKQILTSHRKIPEKVELIAKSIKGGQNENFTIPETDTIYQKILLLQPGMMAYTCNPSTWETEAEGS
jgi:hypothetical protein